MTRLDIANIMASNFNLEDTSTSTIALVIDNVLAGYDLSDITESDLIECIDNELFIQLWALKQS